MNPILTQSSRYSTHPSFHRSHSTPTPYKRGHLGQMQTLRYVTKIFVVEFVDRRLYRRLPNEFV